MAWVHVPETDCPSAQAAVASILASCLPSRDITLVVSSNGSGTRRTCSGPQCVPDTSPTPRSGTMSPPSTDARSADTSTLSSPGIHARAKALPESASAKPTSAGYGTMSPGSSSKSTHSGFFSKTSMAISPSAQKPFSEPYGTWVSRLRLAHSRRLKRERRRSARDGSVWPAPMAGSPAQNGNSAAGNSDFTRKVEAQAAELARRLWPAPATRDVKGENSPEHLQNGTGRLHLDQLPNFVAYLFTRPDLKRPTTGVASSIWRPISRRMFRCAMSNVPRTTQRRWLRRGSWRKRRLCSWFDEWLMGWPPGHALCQCSATAFIRWQRDMRGALSALPTASCQWIWKPPAETQTKQLSLFPGEGEP